MSHTTTGLYYPGANHSHRYDHKFPGSYIGGVTWRGVLHSTETPSLPSYKSRKSDHPTAGQNAPHFTVDPVTGRVWQHFDTARPARALEHNTSIETNNARAVQIEIMAYSDRAQWRKGGKRGVLVEDLTPAQLLPVQRLMQWISAKHQIPAKAGVDFKAYPSSYGTHNGVRMSGHTWKTFHGWCGHSHVPDNVHGDPSDIAIHTLLGQLEEDTLKITKSTGQYGDVQDLGREWSGDLRTGHNGVGKKTSYTLCAGPGYASGVVSVYTTGIGMQDSISMRTFVVEPAKPSGWKRVVASPIVEQAGSVGKGFFQYAFAQDLQPGQRIRFEANTAGGAVDAQIIGLSFNAAVIA